MGFWQKLIGTNLHCVGCGCVVPEATAFRRDGEVYCGEPCWRTVNRLSNPPSTHSTPQNPPAQGGNDGADRPH